MMSGREDEGRVVTLGGEISALGGISADISGSSAGRPRSGAGSTAGGGFAFFTRTFSSTAAALVNVQQSGAAAVQCSAHLFTSESSR